MMLCWFLWLLCLSASAEITAVYRQPKHVTVECSITGCLSSISGFVGMYLFKDGKEVLYCNSDPADPIKIYQMRYKGRLQKKGSLQDNIIIISNLTVADSGVYSCVYVKFPRRDAKCNVHTIEIIEEAPQPSAELPSTSVRESTRNTSCPSLSYIIIVTSAISVFFTVTFILLMILMVKRWAGRKRLTTNPDPGVPNEYVYEVMTTNGFHPVTENSPIPCA